jgi:hypothetical protein
VGLFGEYSNVSLDVDEAADAVVRFPIFLQQGYIFLAAGVEAIVVHVERRAGLDWDADAVNCLGVSGYSQRSHKTRDGMVGHELSRLGVQPARAFTERRALRHCRGLRGRRATRRTQKVTESTTAVVANDRGVQAFPASIHVPPACVRLCDPGGVGATNGSQRLLIGSSDDSGRGAFE